jgi:Na+-transporting NADH:ubiquinone oxidoreductase subunit B
LKFIENFFQKSREDFEEGGKLYKWRTFYETFFTFMFTPDITTKKGSHIRDSIDLKRTMFVVVIALIPATLFGMWNLGYQHYIAIGQESGLWENFWFGLLQSLPMILVSYIVGLGIEFLFALKHHEGLQEGFLVSGLLIPLIMPVNTPLWMVAVATAFAVVIGKEVFGGTGMNIVNIAITARAFLFFAYPTQMSGNKVWIDLAGEAPVDGFTGATALGLAVQGGTEAVNNAGMTLMSSFWGTIPGSIGETSVAAILIGALLLVYTGIASWKIIVSGIVGGAVMGMIFNWAGPQFFPDNLYLQLDWLHHLVLGGFMFGIVFMATDPVTAAQTEKGKWIYGFFIGFLAILIRTVNPAYPEGMMMAILFMNIMAPLIDHYVVQGNIKKRVKRLKLAKA